VDTTWDGLPVTVDWPRGTSVVVRRRPDGYVLLLHRAHLGRDFHGDWAWTTPAGSRQPGEAILECTQRELLEEAGLFDVELAPVDLTGNWALFTAEVDAATPVRLGDVEHDRFEWVPADVAEERVMPRIVAGGLRRAVAVPMDLIAFAPLRRSDLPDVVGWLSAAHVRRWWPDAVADDESAEAEYGPRIDGRSATSVDVMLVAGRPVGFVELTPLTADPEYLDVAQWTTDGGSETFAIDYAIGDSAMVGLGLGTRMLWQYIRDVVVKRFPDMRFVVTDPETANVASIRACEKAGFRRTVEFETEPERRRHSLCLFDRGRVFGDPS
jgi:8-oxo-dGTP pyrophosphatase MutT (NUDIX family)